MEGFKAWLVGLDSRLGPAAGIHRVFGKNADNWSRSMYRYMGIVQKVLDLSVVLDDLWYAKMTFGES